MDRIIFFQSSNPSRPLRSDESSMVSLPPQLFKLPKKIDPISNSLPNKVSSLPVIFKIATKPINSNNLSQSTSGWLAKNFIISQLSSELGGDDERK